MEKEVYILEEIRGAYEDRSTTLVGVYFYLANAEAEKKRLNDYWDDLDKKAYQLYDMGIERYDAHERITCLYLEKANPEVFECYKRASESDGVYEELDEFYEAVDAYMLSHDADEYVKYAMECGYTEEVARLLEACTALGPDNDHPWYTVSTVPVIE